MEDVNEITTTLVEFLKSPEDRQNELIAEYPFIFQDVVLDALKEAQIRLQSTIKEVKETTRAIDMVAAAVDVPGGLTTLQGSEKEALENEDFIYSNFAQTLSSIITANQQVYQSRTLNAPLQEKKWFNVSSIVLEVFSYLPAEEIFSSAEYVCRDWMCWMSDSEVASPFWLGVVQREFPEKLKVLLATEGPSMLLDSDWRSIAMLCVVENEEETEEAS